MARWAHTLWIGIWALGCEVSAPSVDVEAQIQPGRHTRFQPIEACATCHPRQAKEYARSPMAYAASSPVFAALELALSDISGGAFSDEAEGQGRNLCVNCHAPVAVAEGIGQPRDHGGRPHRARLTAPADQGISCDFCHRVTGPDHGASPLGDGVANMALAATPGVTKLGPFAAPAPNSFHYGAQSEAGAAVGAVDGGDEPFISSAAFCGGCHDVRLPLADVTRPERDTDGAPMSRLENLFTEWRESPWAQPAHPLNPLRGQRGIVGTPGGDLPLEAGEQVTCQDCHMSLYPRVRFEDARRYDQGFEGVDPATLTRKAHKLYPAGPAVSEEATPGAAPRRRLSVHDFTAVSQPVIPFPGPDQQQAVAPWPDPDAGRAAARRAADARGVGRRQACPEDAFGQPTCTSDRRVEMLSAAVTLRFGEVPAEVAPGDALTIPVWLENVGAGHNVPAGFSQEREVWVAFTALDDGRPCEVDDECLDLVAPRRFVDDYALPCVVHGPDGAVDPVLDPESGLTRSGAARRERSGLCDPVEKVCVIYRSGYLVDRDGDGRLHDEDLRHVLTELDPESLDARCVLPGPDADLRPLGVDEGLVRFTNAFQSVAVDEAGAPISSDRADELDPAGAPAEEAATARALWDRHRYLGVDLTDPVTGEIIPRVQQLEVDHPLSASRMFDGAALKPFEPRLARYTMPLPEGVVGPIRISAALRYRFFPPKLLRALAARADLGLVHETQLDEALQIVRMAGAYMWVEISQPQ